MHEEPVHDTPPTNFLIKTAFGWLDKVFWT